MTTRSISDLIENFIKQSLDADTFIELSRNDLAKFFACVPSQINYVLNTRFTVNNGFVVESRRGGSGFVKVSRVIDNNDNYLINILNICETPLSLHQAVQIIDHMHERNLIMGGEADLLKSAISTKALNNPINIDNNIRSNIMRQIIIDIMKRKHKI